MKRFGYGFKYWAAHLQSRSIEYFAGTDNQIGCRLIHRFCSCFIYLLIYFIGTSKGGFIERETIRNDVEAARTLLKEMDEHFNKLEAEVTIFDFRF